MRPLVHFRDEIDSVSTEDDYADTKLYASTRTRTPPLSFYSSRHDLSKGAVSSGTTSVESLQDAGRMPRLYGLGITLPVESNTTSCANSVSSDCQLAYAMTSTPASMSSTDSPQRDASLRFRHVSHSTTSLPCTPVVTFSHPITRVRVYRDASPPPPLPSIPPTWMANSSPGLEALDTKTRRGLLPTGAAASVISLPSFSVGPRNGYPLPASQPGENKGGPGHGGVEEEFDPLALIPPEPQQDLLPEQTSKPQPPNVATRSLPLTRSSTHITTPVRTQSLHHRAPVPAQTISSDHPIPLSTMPPWARKATNHVILSRKSFYARPTLFSSLLSPFRSKKRETGIRGAFVIDPALQISEGLLDCFRDALGDESRDRRDNIRLEVENGSIDVDLYLVPSVYGLPRRQPENHETDEFGRSEGRADTTKCRGDVSPPKPLPTLIDLRLKGSRLGKKEKAVKGLFSLVAKIHAPHPRPPFHIFVTTLSEDPPRLPNPKFIPLSLQPNALPQGSSLNGTDASRSRTTSIFAGKGLDRRTLAGTGQSQTHRRHASAPSNGLPIGSSLSSVSLPLASPSRMPNAVVLKGLTIPLSKPPTYLTTYPSSVHLSLPKGFRGPLIIWIAGGTGKEAHGGPQMSEAIVLSHAMRSEAVIMWEGGGKRGYFIGGLRKFDQSLHSGMTEHSRTHGMGPPTVRHTSPRFPEPQYDLKCTCLSAQSARLNKSPKKLRKPPPCPVHLDSPARYSTTSQDSSSAGPLPDTYAASTSSSAAQFRMSTHSLVTAAAPPSRVGRVVEGSSKLNPAFGRSISMPIPLQTIPSDSTVTGTGTVTPGVDESQEGSEWSGDFVEIVVGNGRVYVNFEGENPEGR